jgi:hypothetical protein
MLHVPQRTTAAVVSVGSSRWSDDHVAEGAVDHDEVATAKSVGRGADCEYGTDPGFAGDHRGVREKAAHVGDERTGAG